MAVVACCRAYPAFPDFQYVCPRPEICRTRAFLIMPRLHWPTSRWAQGLWLGLLAASLTGAVGALGWTQSLERNALDALFGARGPRFLHPKILIVTADNETVERVDQWPLPRAVYAQVVRRLHKDGARVIALDALFPTHSPRPAEDADFARTCALAGNVIQAAAFHVDSGRNSPLPVNLHGDRIGLEKRFRVADAGAISLNAVWVSSALPELRKSALAVGHVTVFPESDGKLRHIPHLIRYRGEVYPSLALAAAVSYLGLRPPQVLGDAQGVRLPLPQGEQRVPLDIHGESPINWVGGNYSFPTFSVNELLDGKVRPEAIKDALIFVGVTAAGAYEQRATPFSPNQPAVELQANAADDILSNRPLREMTPLAVALLVTGFALLMGLAVSSQQGWGGNLWFAVLSFALWQSALTSLRHDWHVPLAAPLLAGTMVWIGTTVLNYRQELRENWRADAAVAALARGGALLASRQDLAQLRRAICETARVTLQAQQVFLLFEGESPADGDQEIAPLRQLAATVAERARICRWPETAVRSERKSRGASLLAAPGPVVAAPLPRRTDHVGERSVVPRRGVLVALRPASDRAFTVRDEMLLGTLAEQASLALSHHDYAEILRSKVELADRELLETNALLSEQSVKLTAAVESIHTALIITDELGRAKFSNAATALILQEATPPFGAMVSQHLCACGLPDIADLCDAALREGTQGNAEDLRCETLREIKDSLSGHVIARAVLQAQLTPLQGGDSRFLGVMLAITDITAQRDLDAMKTDFVSFVAHELRSPLTSILGYASLLQSAGDRIDAPQRGEMTIAIMRQGTRLNRMIGELLDVSRLDAGKPLDMRFSPVDLTALCRVALDNQRAGLQGKSGYELEMSAPETPVMIRADTDRIEQILTNLLSNAVKYTPRGGCVRLQVEDAATHAIVRVSDEGIGMTPEQMTSLFQKFYRTPDARSRGIKGTGLGLYLVKQLVEAHKGTIHVESAFGQGTTFIVKFPM